VSGMATSCGQSDDTYMLIWPQNLNQI
jgi:hypothetical protein